MPKPPISDETVGVTELLHGLGREGAAHAAGAVDDDLGVLVEQATLDLRFEVTTRDVDRVGQRTLVVLVGLADVEHDRAGRDALGSGRRCRPR